MNTITISANPPPSLSFDLPDGRTVIVPPATRARLEAATACDCAGEGARGRVLAALVGPLVHVAMAGAEATEETDSAPILAALAPAQELEWIAALQGQANGIDPIMAVEMHRVMLLRFFIAQQTSKD